MFRINNIKRNVLILSFATLLAGCGGGGTTTTTSTDATSTDLTTTSNQKPVEVQTREPITTEDSATIEWIPYEYSTKSVEYGIKKKQYDLEVLVQEEGTVTLYNLQPNTTYYYILVSEDEKGRKLVSDEMTFTTEPGTQPIITDTTLTEPTVTEPASTEPIITEPIVTEPAPTEPIVTEPTVTESAPTETNVTEPTITEPASTEPIVTEPAPTEPIIEETQTVCIEGNAKIEGHVTDKDTGAGLVGVHVNVGGCVTTTDAQGDYTLTNIAANDKAVVTFSIEGYYKNSTIIQIDQYLEGTTDLSSNYTVVEMDKYINHWAYDSQTVVSGANIEIAAGVYINNDGSPYIGQVTAGLSYRTSAEKGTDIEFPGDYKGKDSNGNIIPFVSYGFTVIDLIDMNGNTLNVSQNITLKFEATGATENIIPLWYYDYEQGLWLEEGYAERQSNGTYNGEISHPGTWSLNKPIEADSGIYRGRIIYSDGVTAKDVRVYAVGDNWVKADLSTDQDGMFEIEVTPGSSFQLKAYNYKDKYDAVYNSIIPAIASGETVEDRI